MTEKLLTVKDVAEYLRVSERTVFNYMKDRRLVGRKIGKSWRFEQEDVKEFARREGTQEAES